MNRRGTEDAYNFLFEKYGDKRFLETFTARELQSWVLRYFWEQFLADHQEEYNEWRKEKKEPDHDIIGRRER